MARPRKEINQAEFEKLCGLQCSKEEICGWFSITDKTLDAWAKRTYNESYSEVYNTDNDAVLQFIEGMKNRDKFKSETN